MLFTFNLPTNLKHAILRHVYEISGGDAEGVYNAWCSRFADVRDCVGMENWEVTHANGDHFEFRSDNLTFCIYVSGYYNTCDRFEVAIYRGEYKEEIASITNIKSLEEALEIVGAGRR